MALLQVGLQRLVSAGGPGAAGLALPQLLQRLQRLQQQRSFAVVSGEDSHDDFKPKYKADPVDDVKNTIENDINDNQVFIYMKGTPDAPQCGFSSMACQILNAYGFKYGSRNVLADQGIREGIKKFTQWPTIPQVFVKGEFVGGSDVLMEMHKAGELQHLAEELVDGSK